MNDEMMKHKHLLFFLPTVLAILLSCEGTGEKTPVVQSDGLEDFTFSAEGGTRSFTVKSDRIWTLSKADLDWADVSLPAGDAGETFSVTLTVPKNETVDAREGRLILGSGEYRKEVTVHQDFGGFISPSLPSVLLPSVQEEGVRLTVRSNVDWRMEGTLPGWLRIRPSEGSAGTTALTLWADDNKAREARSFDFRMVSGAMSSPATVSVVQDGLSRQPFLSVSGTVRDTVFFGPDPKLSEIIVSTNCDWSVSGVPSWLTLNHTEGEGAEGDIAVSILPEPNNARTGKGAVLTFQADNDAVPPVTLYVWQDGYTIKSHRLAGWTVAGTSQMKQEWPGYVVGASGALVDISNSVAMAASDNPEATLQFVYSPAFAARTKFRTAISNTRFIVFYFCIGDAFVFSVPGVTAYEGMRVNLRAQLYPYTMYTVKSYMVEFLEDGVWQPAEGKGSSLTFSHPVNSADKERDDGDINAFYTLKRDYLSEDIIFRVRATTNESIRGDKNTNSSGRIELGANTDLKELSVWLLSE